MDLTEPSPERLEWQIQLAWRQKLAAFWSITWPAVVACFLGAFPFIVIVGHSSKSDLAALSVATRVAFYVIQAALIHRIVRKKYRSFRVEVVRDDGQRSRSMTTSEGLRVWLRVFWPQIVFIILTSLLLRWSGSRLPAETARSITSLSLWLTFLVVGPFGIDLAMRAHYRGFRLRAYGWRFI